MRSFYRASLLPFQHATAYGTQIVYLSRRIFQRIHQRLSLSLLLGFCLSISLNLSMSSISLAQQAQLTINDGKQLRVWSQKELFSHPATREITIKNDPAYQREMHYRALPVLSVLPEVAGIDSLQFVALDGFVANLRGSDLAGAGMPMIAIEDDQHRWPDLPKQSSADEKKQAQSAGPFYLVWLKPLQGKIGSEQWPYQIKAINASQRLEQRFPQIIPHAASPVQQAQTLRGMAVYLKNCSVCHPINGAGDASIGPDLNLPFNPTEYFKADFLRKLIRQPASVRSWKQGQMPGFSSDEISNKQLDDLLAYLKQISLQRQKIP